MALGRGEPRSWPSGPSFLAFPEIFRLDSGGCPSVYERRACFAFVECQTVHPCFASVGFVWQTNNDAASCGFTHRPCLAFLSDPGPCQSPIMETTHVLKQEALSHSFARPDHMRLTCICGKCWICHVFGWSAGAWRNPAFEWSAFRGVTTKSSASPWPYRRVRDYTGTDLRPPVSGPAARSRRRRG